MAVKPVVFTQFSGGWSTDMRVGLKNSFAYSQGFDFRKSPSQLSVLPGPIREDGGIMKDLLLNEVMTPSGIIWAFGNQGYIYKRLTNGTWSNEGKLSSGCAGEDYRQDSDSIYFASNKTVSLLNPISTTPVLSPDKYGPSFSTYDNSENAGFNVSSYQVGSTQTTKILTAPLSEGQTSLRYFQSDIEPLNKISLFITNKGSGDWTLTLHDGLNNALGTSTVTNANLKNNAFNDFLFTTATNGQVRIYVAPNARTYHIHVTSTVADGFVASSIQNDLSTADLEIWADRLIQTNNGLHPIERFLQYEAIGNANYLSVWEPLSDPPTNDEWLRHKLVFPQEYEVCGLAILNEYIAIACERTSTTGIQDGIIFWWDGLSSSYNYFTAIPEGAPYGIRQYGNVVYYYAGGSEYAIAGANSLPEKIRQMPGSDTEFSGSAATINVYPYTSTTRRGIHLIGYPSTTTNTSINFGAYSWGQVDKNYPQSFGYNYIISTGTQNYTTSNNLQIGMVRNFGDTLHISWRDDLNGGYGVDVVNNASKPVGLAKWESLVFDNGYPSKYKTARYMECYFPNLPSGASLVMKYRINSAAAWIYDTTIYTSTNTWQGIPGYARFGINGVNGGRFYELQVGIEVACDSTVTQSPVPQMVSFVFDDNTLEQL